MRFCKQLWKNVRHRVHELNPKLATIIDAIEPGDKHYFYEASYHFGECPIEKGSLNLPLQENDIVNIDDSSMPASIKNDLDYSLIPVGFILSKGLEVFAEPKERCSPLAMLNAGTIFGVWETLDPTLSIYVSRAWNISAGARTIFFLPKISQHLCHQRLKSKYGIQENLTSNIFHQWHIFKSLIRAIKSCDWSCTILYFSKSWFKQQGSSVAWDAFRYYLLDVAWQQTKNWRNREYGGIFWETFLSTFTENNLKPSPNELNYVRHLIDIAHGIYPGFRPAMSDQLAPIKELQRIYLEDYRLETHAPILFEPFAGDLNTIAHNPVYFSVQHPSNLNHIFPSKKNISSIQILRNIITLHRAINEQLSNDKLPVFETIKHISYHYLHLEEDSHYHIVKTKEFIKSDPNIMSLMKQFPDKDFPEASTFLRGSIAVTQAS